MERALLDTDTVSAIMRGNPRVVRRAESYLVQAETLTISAVTRYEVLRGLEAKQASRQITDFHRFCDTLDIAPLSDAVLVRAANLYGELRRSGRLIGDADILIAATCLEHDRVIVTNNVGHFERINALRVENWLAES